MPFEDLSGSRPLRLVLDTNVVVAGLLWNGPPRRLIDLAIDGRTVGLFSSWALIGELADTLRYPKFAARIGRVGLSIDSLVSNYLALVGVMVPASVPRVVADDADDDQLIAAAATADADWIVTGDGHLLTLGRHGGIEIVRAREACDRITSPA